MPYDSSISDRVMDHLTSKRVPFEARKMMGGLCFMVREKMCVCVSKDRLLVRLDPAIMDRALSQPGCVPMDFTGRPMNGFVFVHAEAIESEEQLGYWVGLALEFNPRAKMSRKRTKK
jgi:TfoX/Sxy family transcriptional regulator of competence genes